MIGKLNKDSCMVLFATVLTVIALVYGFTTVPNPAKQREIKLDHKRVSDLGQLQSSIETYFIEHTTLPSTLDEITTTTYTPSGKLSKNDPATNNPYEYLITGIGSYQLCATFTTDSTQEDQSISDAYDEGNYTYTSFRDKFHHPAGRKCFDFTVQRTNTLYDSLNLQEIKPRSGIVPRVMTLPAGNGSISAQ